MKKGNVQKYILLVSILLAVNMLSGCSDGSADTETVTAAKKIKETARAGDVIMILGAGNVDIIADLLKE